MNVVGLIVEYNPLHHGHAYHFQKAKAVTQAEACVVVMSGHFLQRGEPAIVNKWARAEMALQMGADIVLELPYVYATQHAEHFAYGATSILNHLPFVTHLCFGSESGHLNELQKLAQWLLKEPTSFQQQLRAEMRKGKSYPKAFSDTLATIDELKDIDPRLYSEPNNILGLYYLISLLKLNSPIQPATIQRIKAHYHDRTLFEGDIASATAIREAIFENRTPDWDRIKSYVPPYTLDILKRESEEGRGPIHWECYFDLLRHTMISLSPEALSQIYEIEEGIEYRLKNEILHAKSFQELLTRTKTKRYTWNRIQRMMVHTYTNMHKRAMDALQLENGASYLRILGFSETGKNLLNTYKKSLDVPLISKIKKERPPMLEWDIQASKQYVLGYQNDVPQHLYREYKQAPIQGT
ncbi:nucleotidyltransferase [Caldalkalibacillus salinus]|uniref:nucleotidyltransferase n=1 Tax=Caldalkalibacillus salinus TaxID=2803787 RepID=UPI001920EC52